MSSEAGIHGSAPAAVAPAPFNPADAAKAVVPGPGTAAFAKPTFKPPAPPQVSRTPRTKRVFKVQPNPTQFL